MGVETDSLILTKEYKVCPFVSIRSVGSKEQCATSVIPIYYSAEGV